MLISSKSLDENIFDICLAALFRGHIQGRKIKNKIHSQYAHTTRKKTEYPRAGFGASRETAVAIFPSFLRLHRPSRARGEHRDQ